jgi:[acyl-carrier-protein] S-malonyltransferase
MREALAGATIARPLAPLVANVLAAPISDPEQIRRRLVEQVTGRVRWRESVAAMGAAGVGRFLEIGSGKVLAGLVKRILPEAAAASFGAPDDRAGVAQLLS